METQEMRAMVVFSATLLDNGYLDTQDPMTLTQSLGVREAACYSKWSQVGSSVWLFSYCL